MRNSIHKALTKEFSNNPETVGKVVDLSKIKNSEKVLDVRLPDDYKEFIHKYGGAIINGHEIFGLSKAAWMSENYNYMSQSKRFRNELPNKFSQMVVFSIDGAGNPVGFLPGKSSIFVFDHNFGGRYDMAKSFEEYIEKILEGKMDETL